MALPITEYVHGFNVDLWRFFPPIKRMCFTDEDPKRSETLWCSELRRKFSSFYSVAVYKLERLSFLDLD